MKRAERTRNAGTWTESAFQSAIRSALRSKFRYWKPAMMAANRHSRPYKGKNKRRKKEIQCQGCKKWYAPSNIQIDHVVPCGSLKDENGEFTGESLMAFIERLTPEDPMAFQPLCKPCHKEKTRNERRKK